MSGRGVDVISKTGLVGRKAEVGSAMGGVEVGNEQDVMMSENINNVRHSKDKERWRMESILFACHIFYKDFTRAKPYAHNDSVHYNHKIWRPP
jgi:hypothetical protein